MDSQQQGQRPTASRRSRLVGAGKWVVALGTLWYVSALVIGPEDMTVAIGELCELTRSLGRLPTKAEGDEELSKAIRASVMTGMTTSSGGLFACGFPVEWEVHYGSDGRPVAKCSIRHLYVVCDYVAQGS
jgi:hypothetical protein